MHPPNQRLGKPNKLSKGAHSQTSYPRFNGKTLWIKGDCRTPAGGEGGRRKEVEKER